MSKACVKHVYTSTDRTVLDAALRYASRGWCVIPLKGKAPLCAWKRYQTVAPTPKSLTAMFSTPKVRDQVTGIAVVTGEVSGRLRIRDYDEAAAYDAWAAAHPQLAATLPTARTRRGYHVYFRADVPDATTKFDDGELRAGKGYTALPPSEHPDGGHYEWLAEPGDEVPLLDDLHAAGLIGPKASRSTDAPKPAGPAAPEPEGAPLPPEVEEAVAASLPSGPGQRCRKLWELARRLIGVEASPTDLDRYIREWHRRALPFIGTKDFDTTEADFYEARKKANIKLSDDEIRQMVARELDRPEPNWFVDWYFPNKGKVVLRVCVALQRHAGQGPFFLSARKAGEFAGANFTLAARHLRNLVAEGYLMLLTKGTQDDRRASEYVYVGPTDGLDLETDVLAQLVESYCDPSDPSAPLAT